MEFAIKISLLLILHKQINTYEYIRSDYQITRKGTIFYIYWLKE